MSRRDKRTPSSNPLLANTEAREDVPTETEKEERVTPQPSVVPQSEVHTPVEQPPVIEPTQVVSPPVEQVVEVPLPPTPVQPPVVSTQPTYVAPTLPPAPQARRVNRKVKFNDQFDKRTLSIDKRLLPYFDALMENGPNKTVVANQWVLKMLLDAGYQIDPNILTQPYKKPR